MPPDPVPCPACGKPIQPGAANCWACGAVFDTVPCPKCDSAVKRGAFLCWFCGAQMPIVPRLAGFRLTEKTSSENIQAGPTAAEPVQSDAIQTSPSSPWSSTETCSHCGEKLAPPYRYCPACGLPLQVTRRQVHWDDQPVKRPHRAGALLTLAIISLFGGPCGLVIGMIVAARATLDMGAMRDGRMDSSGEGMTHIAFIIATAAALIQGAIMSIALTRW